MQIQEFWRTHGALSDLCHLTLAVPSSQFCGLRVIPKPLSRWPLLSPDLNFSLSLTLNPSRRGEKSQLGSPSW